MKSLKHILILFLFLFSIIIQAQESLKAYEDILLQLQTQLYSSKSDKEKAEVNAKLKSSFERALSFDQSFEYSFDSLKGIGRIYSPDKLFRIINWDVPKADGTYDYYGFIQCYDAKKKKYLIFPLTDKSQEIKNADNSVGDANKWFGMLYYKIIPIKVRRKKYYTLLGGDSNDKLTSKKVIDILSFAPDGSPRFGADIFKFEKKSPKRVILEYSAQSTMSLKYDEDTKQIIFDHLSPVQPKFEGQFQYYGPDFSFDAFEFKKGKWLYIADVDARNGKSNKDNKYNDPKGKGTNSDNKKFYAPKK